MATQVFIKIFEKINNNHEKVIEFEDVVDEFFSVQKRLQDKTRDFVKDIFNAADVSHTKWQSITFP